jgi:hypothetical protein
MQLPGATERSLMNGARSSVLGILVVTLLLPSPMRARDGQSEKEAILESTRRRALALHDRDVDEVRDLRSFSAARPRVVWNCSGGGVAIFEIDTSYTYEPWALFRVNNPRMGWGGLERGTVSGRYPVFLTESESVALGCFVPLHLRQTSAPTPAPIPAYGTTGSGGSDWPVTHGTTGSGGWGPFGIR